MFRWIILLFTVASLISCAVPVSSSCIESQQYHHPDAHNEPNNSKCDATDAAVYLIAATLKTLAEREEKPQTKGAKAVKCSDMVGKAQKECVRKERELYDPLDDL